MEPQPSNPAVEMKGIRKSFFGQEVLRGIDLRLEPGKVHGLVGHNGAGKSTLMKVLAGVHSDYEGQIFLEGKPVHPQTPGEARNLGIGVIHQEFSLVPLFDAAENLMLGREPRRGFGLIDHRRIREDSVTALERYGFNVPTGIPVAELSVAHQQLTEIAKALSLNARVLVMDEPTSRLAPSEREALFAVIRRLVTEGVTIVYISHFLEEVLNVCDEVTVLRDGQVVDERPSKDFTLESLSEQIVGEEAPEAFVVGDGKRGKLDEKEPFLVLEDFGPTTGSGVNLSLCQGEIVGLAGLVGAGRTEILESISGARPAQGNLRIEGKAVHPRKASDGVRMGITLVPEDRKSKGLVMERGTSDNVVLSALASKFSRVGFVKAKERRAAYEDAIRRFRILTSNPDAPTRTLSGGNQQKVLLARSATIEPKVLLLDQPTAGVDIGAKAEIYQHIESLVDDGATCLVASDELEELLRLCHRIAVVRDGRITTVRDAADFDEQNLLAEMSRSEP